MIAREWRAFLAAVQFLTRIPISAAIDAQSFASSPRYFSIVGALIGGVIAAVLLAATILFPQPAPVVLALAVGAVLSGALHEDGLADCADGLFGGQTRERRLEIMKDSRIGTFGVLALLFVIGLKVASLTALDPMMAALSLIAAHAGGRAAALAAMRWLPYAGDTAKISQPRVSGGDLAFAVGIAAVAGLATLQWQAWLIGIVIAIAAAAPLALAAKRLIGGQTGDVLGAIEQIFEAGFLLGAASVIAGPG